MDYQTINLKTLSDKSGNLISLEGLKNIPFEIKRVFYIFSITKNMTRGEHAHKTSKQVAICLNGFCKFSLDNGKEKNEFTLNKPDKALYMANNVWRKMHGFSGDCILMVLASDFYNESGYIIDYNEFLNFIKT
jgi:dTDP-4-dehydrorhamnose 3,5-epimerase-like enzyme